MCQDHDHVHEEEIDLIDLLGVIIKRRKFIVWFVVCFTVLTSLLVFFKEYRHSALVSKTKFTASDIMITDNDAVMATYRFLNKADKQDGYKDFVNMLLFPTATDTPAFEIQKGEGSSFGYLFLSSKDAQRFAVKYNSFVDSLVKIKEYGKKMSEGTFASCKQIYGNKLTGSARDLSMMIGSEADVRNCNIFNYYYGLVQGQTRYVTGNSLEDYFYPFIIDIIKEPSLSKLKLADPKDIKGIESKAKSSFNSKKVIKYTAILFIVSVLLAFALAYVLEFWSKNKVRLSGYWR